MPGNKLPENSSGKKSEPLGAHQPMMWLVSHESRGSAASTILALFGDSLIGGALGSDPRG